MLNEPLDQEIDGKTYKVEGFTIQVQQYAEKHMQKILLDDLKAMRPLLDDEDYFGLLEKHARDKKRGLLNFGSDRHLRFLDEDGNFAELLKWCFLKYDPASGPVVDEWVKTKSDEAIALWKRLYESKKN